MESLGKELDLGNHVVNQGITVLGNKGSTDQHSYIQQLRDGLPNFFVTFIEVLKDENHPSLMVEPEVTSGDFLHGFYSAHVKPWLKGSGVDYYHYQGSFTLHRRAADRPV